MQYWPSILPCQQGISMQQNKTVPNSNTTIHIRAFKKFRNPNSSEQQMKANNKSIQQEITKFAFFSNIDIVVIKGQQSTLEICTTQTDG